VNALFADTFFYLALVDEHDPAHTHRPKLNAVFPNASSSS
jgi:hypothetical protein